MVLLLTPQKETPLANAVFWAVRKGNLALLQLLLNSGRVDADCRDSVRVCPSLKTSLFMFNHLSYTSIRSAIWEHLNSLCPLLFFSVEPRR